MSMAERGYGAVDFSQFVLPEEDLATIPPGQVSPPVDAAQGIRESIAGMDAAARADALRGLGPGFLGEDFYNQYNPDGTVRGATSTVVVPPVVVPPGTVVPVVPPESQSPPTNPFLPQQRSDAFSRMRALLARFGLSELEGAVNSIITSGMVDLEDANAIVFALRDQPAYKRRFAGNAARAAAGLAELDPSTYIGLEEQYRQMLRANGLDPEFYNDLTDFQGFIEGDVSPAELQERINQGYRAVADADSAVKAQMKELYNVSDGDLAMFFLDPKRAQPLLTTRERTRKAQAAGIAARGKEQGGIQLTKDEAEALAARGITGEEAFQRFGEMGTLAGLYERLYGEEDINREQQLGATFRYDTSALDAVRRRQRQRLAQFEVGGQFARTSGATSGTVETGAGLAQ